MVARLWSAVLNGRPGCEDSGEYTVQLLQPHDWTSKILSSNIRLMNPIR